MTTDIPRRELPGTGALTVLGTGGEGSVYALPESAIPQQLAAAVGGRKVVYKEFRTPDSPAQATHHRAVAGMFRKFGVEQQRWLLDRASWPLATVTDGNTVVGILMPVIPETFYREFPASGGRTNRGEAGFQMLLNDSRYLQKMDLQMSGKMKYAVLSVVCDMLRVLQGGGIVVGDLSARNLMFSTGDGAGAPASAYLIDCDSVSTPGSANPDSMETPGWEVPSGEARQTKESDRYKFGLLVLRLLAGDQTTRDPGRLPADVPLGVRSLVEDTLTADPAARPSFDAWWEALQQAVAIADASVTAAQTLAVTPAVKAPAVAPVVKRSKYTQRVPGVPHAVPAVSQNKLQTAPNTVQTVATAGTPSSVTVPWGRLITVLILLFVAACAVSMGWYSVSWEDHDPGSYRTGVNEDILDFPFKWILYGIIALGAFVPVLTMFQPAETVDDDAFFGGGIIMVGAVVLAFLLRNFLLGDQLKEYGDGASVSLSDGAWLYLGAGVLIIVLTWGVEMVKAIASTE